jgi:hypothetical protein
MRILRAWIDSGFRGSSDGAENSAITTVFIPADKDNHHPDPSLHAEYPYLHIGYPYGNRFICISFVNAPVNKDVEISNELLDLRGGLISISIKKQHLIVI